MVCTCGVFIQAYLRPDEGCFYRAAKRWQLLKYLQSSISVKLLIKKIVQDIATVRGNIVLIANWII